ncbi:MAG: hypothetical protein IPJ98_19205 [Bryobacterales bacterium]|nr:hypothetical protein [Bryobacterales bacterium]
MKPTIALFILAAVALPAFAQRGEPFRATVRGSGDSGKCTIEVRVDDVAEVEVRGETGYLRTLQGQPASWVRFVCNAPFPSDMQEFKFKGIDGRGRVELRRDPRDNRGSAVVYIVDTKGGSEGYTFDLEWKGGYLSGNRPRGGVTRRDDSSGNRSSGNSGGFFGRSGGGSSNSGGRSSGGFFGDSPSNSTANSVRACQEEIANRLRRDNYSNFDFGSASLSDRAGKRDWMAGEGRARRSGTTYTFDYACRMDLDRAQVREVDYRVR